MDTECAALLGRLPLELVESVEQARLRARCQYCQQSKWKSHFFSCGVCGNRVCYSCNESCYNCSKRLCPHCQQRVDCCWRRLCGNCILPNCCSLLERDGHREECLLEKVCSHCRPPEPQCPGCDEIVCTSWFDCSVSGCNRGRQLCASCDSGWSWSWRGADVETDEGEPAGRKRECVFCGNNFCIYHCLRLKEQNVCTGCLDALTDLKNSWDHYLDCDSD